MAPIILAEFLLTIDIDSFSETFWSDNSWYEKFLVEKLCDLSVHVGEWTLSSNSQMRNIRSFHPAKISFPGLPSHAEVAFCISVILFLYNVSPSVFKSTNHRHF